MIKNAYTEEEFKKMVKTLLVDKQRDEEESEIEILRNQLEKVRPALNKLNADLRVTKDELERLQEKEAAKLAEKEHDIAGLLGQKMELIAKLEVEKEKSAESEQKLKMLTIKTLSDNQALNQRLEALSCQSDITHLRHEKENHFEEMLAISYEKMRELFQKNSTLVEEVLTLKEKVAHREEEIASLETAVQTSKVKASEKEGDVRKAQGHLVKKVKEAALLRDVLERQKRQLLEQQTQLLHQKNEIEKLKNALQMQLVQEERIEMAAKESATLAENLSRECQAKQSQYDALTAHLKTVKAYLIKAFETPSDEDLS